MSGAGISYVLGRLTQMEVIEKVDRHRPGRSATYRWKPSDRQTLLGNGELRPPETSDDPF
jgi:hypothetical protein